MVKICWKSCWICAQKLIERLVQQMQDQCGSYLFLETSNKNLFANAFDHLLSTPEIFEQFTINSRLHISMFIILCYVNARRTSNTIEIQSPTRTFHSCTDSRYREEKNIKENTQDENDAKYLLNSWFLSQNKTNTIVICTLTFVVVPESKCSPSIY